MDNKVYYGEYSLQHWIELILKKNLILPDYQRFFVWEEEKVKKLINTFKDKYFVPPVTIGAYNLDTKKQNLILDGQQRLTSVFLAYLGLFPDKDSYRAALEDRIASDNEEIEEEEEEQIQFDNLLEWNINELVKKGKRKEDILEKIPQGYYQSIDYRVNEDFFKRNFLGFSYIVPQTTDDGSQQKFYSSVFRNINIQGKRLLETESRKSLYFLDKQLEKFFDPEFFKQVKIKTASSSARVDFIRYLSMLSQFHNDGYANRVARGKKKIMEKYYEDYIYQAINDEDGIYGKFTSIFPNKEYNGRFNNLNNLLSDLLPNEPFPSIINADFYLFGSIYWSVFKDRSPDNFNIDQIQTEIDEVIQQSRDDPNHARSPNNLGYLRYRISESIKIYQNNVSQ